MLGESETKTLLELGLTSRQVKVFLELSKYEAATAKALAVSLKLARQDTYQVLDELQQLGLVEKQINVPTKFAAVSIQDALATMLNRKVKQATELETKTRRLISSFGNQNVKAAENDKFILLLVPEGEQLVSKLRNAINNSQKSIDILSSNATLARALFFLVEEFQKAADRSVRIRCISDVVEVNNSCYKMYQTLNGKESFELRITPHHEKTRFVSFDETELSIVISAEKDFVKDSMLWTNCSSIVEAYQDHYELLWRNANKIIDMEKTQLIIQQKINNPPKNRSQ